ncbi:MAG TPA: hypothetical protein VLJ11_08655 [Bryobacteraceae bacterium]|nr:hypothetical protein [Bryobacteraceae bacterium]
MNTFSLRQTSPAPARGSLTISRDIFALELLPANSGAHSGGIRRVPKGAYLQVCGQGFNDRTIQVRWEGRLCFVFLQDVVPAEAAYTV